METPRVVNERLAVTATRIDVTLAGPLLHAVGAVKSEIAPSTRGQKPGSKDTKLPAMLKPDQPVIVTADELSYDGPAAMAAYAGNAQLYQGETFIKGSTILIDENTGDLAANGSVTTVISLEQETKDKRKERVRSVASAADLKYEEAAQARHVHRRCARHRSTGRHDGHEDRAVSQAVGRGARARRGVRECDPARSESQDHRRPHDLLQRRRAVRRHGRAGDHHRPVRPGHHRQDVDVLQGDR